MSNEPFASKLVGALRSTKLTPTAQLSLSLIVGLLPLLGAATLLSGSSLSVVAVTLAGYLAASLFALNGIRAGYPHDLLGLGNLTTVFRMTLVVALIAPLVEPASRWLIAVIALLALVLDGFDGWLARREGRVSDFGARLDMEVDSAVGVILALNIWAAGIIGPWILILGLPRYVFILAAQFFPWLNGQLPPSLARRVICVVQVSVLIGIMTPIFPDWVVWFAFVVGSALLLWSFGRDALLLWRLSRAK